MRAKSSAIRPLLVLALGLCFAGSALAEQTPAPAGAEAYIISPADGATVNTPLTVRFGLKGMGVAPAGTQVPNTGHHHLIVDADAPAPGQAIPKDAQHLHFGGGQTETVLELPPGRHTLQLLLGDYAHVPHDPPVMSKPITVIVE